MSEAVIYPTVSLYLYDLIEGLGDAKTTSDGAISSPEIRAKDFWRKIYGDDVNMHFHKLQQRERANHSFNELLPGQYESFDDPADGFYYPIQSGDTYALLVDYSGELKDGKQNYDPQDLDSNPFHDRQQEIIQRLHGEAFTLGQTWLLRATLSHPNQPSESIAHTIYQQTFPKSDWKIDYIESGELLGGKIYELWQYPRSITDAATAIASSQHVWIWLFPPEIPQADINDRIAANYQLLIPLFQYRHKIWAAYAQSQEITSSLKTEVVEINLIGDRIKSILSALAPSSKSRETIGKVVETNLDALQVSLLDTLRHFETYPKRLQQLGDQGRTIETNRFNYKQRCQNISTLTSNRDLKFLDLFDNNTHAERYFHQIATDDAALSPQLNYLEKLHQTIDSIIQIEQAKSDRKQTKIDSQTNQIVAAAGIGLATSQLASAAIIAQQPQSIDKASFLFTPPFYVSLSAGIAATILTWLIFNLIQRRHTKKIK